ncbi:recombinase family protein [Streptomyces lunaelactis]|uniref:recombinase family protein n=1 Tax=Streptomyces lunaelactis TaxID=1535768 RepID=UPI0015849681|nr:recombinase family protein [Streptomyces lunaelactis]NUK09497.1 recombinase family protein [Streptomyces lunaelactis]NUK73374.1 recombinase family protein [Streptomyces lunaelactis]NUL10919.1 recombinase family protein [Streptomyces lunaelactis]NUL24511.1 recombinase family protein [Streptomyces lunaelactis]
MRLVAYIRVSTEKQLDGYGLDVQEKAVRAWARQAGHRLGRPIYRDEGRSGTLESAERPGLAAALTEVEDGRAQGILVPALDRFARTLVVQEAILAQIWKHGGRAFTADTGEIHRDDPDDPMRTAMRQMMGVFSQLERSMINARLRNGRREKAAQGGYAYGAPPYGWQAHKKELTPEGMEQAGRARARQLRDEDELSYREIAAVLDAEGLRPKRGERWHPETVRRMLANTTDQPPTLRRRAA